MTWAGLLWMWLICSVAVGFIEVRKFRKDSKFYPNTAFRKFVTAACIFILCFFFWWYFVFTDDGK
jgi:ABC-type uncharacterized transport system permease subunit